MDLRPLRSKLRQWYLQHKRPLPWRENRDPYAIWLSEIILQQTRVSQGLPYFQRFIEAFPNAKALADAPEEQVLKLWEGLGYYSRARNLHSAAKSLRDDFEGQFPEDYSAIRALKGVGDYTAAAIASFAFDQKKAVVDGNVYRVLSRLLGEDTPINSAAGKKLFQARADEFLDPQDPATHNQAIMEFGALQCLPKNPDCGICPLKEACQAKAQDRVADLPVKIKKQYDQERYLNYLHIEAAGQVLLHRRAEGIWKGLYQFPLIESEKSLNWQELQELLQDWPMLDFQPNISILAKHKLSHQSLFIKLWHFSMETKPIAPLSQEYEWFKATDLQDLAFPRPLRKYLDENQLNLPLD